MNNNKEVRTYALWKFRNLPDLEKYKLDRVVRTIQESCPRLTQKDVLEVLLLLGTKLNEIGVPNA